MLAPSILQVRDFIHHIQIHTLKIRYSKNGEESLTVSAQKQGQQRKSLTKE